jgi:prepilin-type N-terminal cleavage/methylation domain-containing protein
MGEERTVKNQTKSSRRLLRKTNQAGFTILEVMVASSILSMAILGGVSLQSSLMTNTRKSNDKAFASEKVLQMFEEIRSHTEGNQEDFDSSLASYSDGANYNLVLSTDRFASNPADPISKNRQLEGKWRFVRQVQIEPLPNDEYARRVSVTMWYADGSGQPVDRERPLAAIAGILKTNIPRTPPTQVYDFFVISIANAPSWWSNLFDFKPAYDAVFGDLEFRNPGLKLRKRYISNLAYGRDPFYLPHTNTEFTAEHASNRLPWTYYYPGKVIATNAGNTLKEDFAFRQINTRVRGDAPGGNTSKIFHITERDNLNQFRPAAMADEFNHGLRSADQRAMERRLKGMSGFISSNDIISNPDLAIVKDAMQQPSLVSFLDGMNRGEYRNSMLSNMHAELTPLPPVTNFSYAAKIPRDERNTTAGTGVGQRDFFARERVVSHPEQLFYANGDTDAMRWRVYAYDMPGFGIPLDSAATNSDTSANRALKNVPHINFFIPTDGTGRNGVFPAQPGYLTNPFFDPATTMTGNEDLVLWPEKIIGNENLQYQYRRTVDHWRKNPNTNTFSGNTPDTWSIALSDITNPLTPIGNLKSRFLVATSRDIFFTDEANDTVNNSEVQRLGNVLGYGTNAMGTWIAFAPTDPIGSMATVAAVNTPATTALQNLVGAGDKIRLNAGMASAGIPPTNLENLDVLYGQAGLNGGIDISNTAATVANRVLNWSAEWNGTAPAGANVAASIPAGAIVLRVSNPTMGHTEANPVVTRHRDFDIGYNPTVFGQTRNGISVNLYNTPTRHGRHAASNTGLPIERRLYGLEYIPSPVNNGSIVNPVGDDVFSDDFRTDLTDNRAANLIYTRAGGAGTAAGNDAPGARALNTARWVLHLKPDAGVFGTNLNNQTIAAETRLIGGQTGNNLVGNLAHLEDGLNGDGDPHRPDDVGTGANENETLRTNLYNVSRTYTYRGTSFDAVVPKSEQTQYMGDPRHMPYADVKALNNYNSSFFCPRNAGDENCDSGNIGFGFRDRAFTNDNTAHATTDEMGGYDGYTYDGRYGGLNGIDVDVHKAYNMYIEGIMSSNSIYNTIAGYTNYIISLGGGIGQRGSHTYAYQIKESPWVSTATSANQGNGEGNATISERGSGGRLRMITSVAPNTASIQNQRQRWSGFHYLGELFPDEYYDFWKENGNLPDSIYANTDDLDLDGDGTTQTAPANINGQTARFYRARYSETPFNLARRERITQEGAVSDFYNGSSDPGTESSRIKHSTNSGNGVLQGNPTAAGRFLSDAFNLSLPETITSTRSFCISSGSCTNPNGSTGAEYTTPFMRGRRNTIKYLNLTGPSQGTVTNTATENTTFYRFGTTLNAASSLIKLSREEVTTGGTTTPADPAKIGYAVINGLDQGMLFGAQSLSRLAQAATLQGFLEGGDRTIPGAATGRVVMLPRLEMTEPDPNKIQTIGNQNVVFKADWLRWDLRKYSPSYPANWYDSAPLQFNAMYSADNGETWKYVNTNNNVPEEKKGKYNSAEQLLGSAAYTMTTPQQTWNFTWDAATLSEGDYLLKIEVYRQGYDVGYSYHQLFLTFKD